MAEKEKIEVVEVEEEAPKKATTKKSSSTKSKEESKETKSSKKNEETEDSKDSEDKKKNNKKSAEEHLTSSLVTTVLFILTLVAIILTVTLKLCAYCDLWVNVFFNILLIIKFICAGLAIAGGIYRYIVKMDSRTNIVIIFLNAFLLLI